MEEDQIEAGKSCVWDNGYLNQQHGFFNNNDSNILWCWNNWHWNQITSTADCEWWQINNFQYFEVKRFASVDVVMSFDNSLLGKNPGDRWYPTHCCCQVHKSQKQKINLTWIAFSCDTKAGLSFFIHSILDLYLVLCLILFCNIYQQW